MSAFSAEAELLLACASVGGQDRAGAMVRARPAIDWDRVIALAAAHCVTPLLYSRIAAGCADSIPRQSFQGLRALANANSMRTHHLADELARLMRALRDAGIGALSYKGPALAVTAYGDIARRQFVDLDILIRQTDLPMAARVLNDLGYAHHADLAAIQGSPFQTCKAIFSRASDLAQIDLHWELNPRYFAFAPDPDSIWSRAATVKIGSDSIPAPCPLDLAILLCVHAARHGWTSLSMVSDVARLLTPSIGIDCDALIAAASGSGAARIVLLGLYLAHDLLDAPVPANLIALANRDAPVMSLASRVKGPLFLDGGSIGESQPWLIPLLTIERARDRLRYLADRLLSPTIDDWQFIRLPRPLFPLYYAVRPIRLAIRVGRSVAGRRAIAQASA